MFGSYIAVFQPPCFLGGITEDPLALVRQRQIDRCRYFLTASYLLFDLLANHHCGTGIETVLQVRVLAKQTKKQMLCFDYHAAKVGSFESSEENHPPCAFCPSFKHEVLCPMGGRMTPDDHRKQKFPRLPSAQWEPRARTVERGIIAEA